MVRITRLAVAVLVYALIGLATASTASGGWQHYCGGPFSPVSYASGSDCYGPRHSLTSNRVFGLGGNGLIVGAAALDTSRNRYGSWVYGYDGYVCHPYSGSRLLYPWMYNADSRRQEMFGEMHYGADRWC